jgi:predicted nucleic acid-binding protein
VAESSKVWKLCETEQAEGYISALTFANLVYVMRKELDPEKIEDVLKKLSLIFHFTDLSVADMNIATAMKWDDFEDALQEATAERIHADYIITRNVKDFQGSEIMALTPSELLARI